VHAVFACNIGGGHAGIELLENADDLRFAKAAFLTAVPSQNRRWVRKSHRYKPAGGDFGLSDDLDMTDLRSCFNRSSMQYRLKRNALSEVRERIKEIAAARVRYGYRRIRVLLRREGWKVNAKRVARLYTQEDLNLRAKGPKRRRRSVVQRVRTAPSGPNQVWSMNFMQTACSARSAGSFACSTSSTFSLGNALRLRIVMCASKRVTSSGYWLLSLCSAAGRSQSAAIKGIEFMAEALDQWAYNNRIELDFSRPGKPTDNAFVESFNASVRKELLNTSWFATLGVSRT
jgi:putative transposase